MKLNNREQLDNLSSQSIFAKIKKGDTRVRVISEIHVVKEHRIKVQDRFRAISCPTENTRMLIASGESQETEVPPCPLCELNYPVNTSYLAAIIEREYEVEGKLKGGQASILKKGPTLMGEIQNLFDDEDWGKAGNYDIKITATGDGFDRKYSVIAIPVEKSKPINAREQLAIKTLTEKASLNEMTVPRPYKEIKEIIGENYPAYEELKED